MLKICDYVYNNAKIMKTIIVEHLIIMCAELIVTRIFVIK